MTSAMPKRLMTIPGVGPLTASAMLAAVGDGAAFRRGRDFGAWLGLVPRQMSTGNRTILGNISNRSNKHLRTLFIQGAWAVLMQSMKGPARRYSVKRRQRDLVHVLR